MGYNPDILKMVKRAAHVCWKLGFPTITSEDYETCVSNFKHICLPQQHLDLIVEPMALRDTDKSVEWETGIKTMYANFPVHCALANPPNAVEPRECATQFLIVQTKMVRQD